MIATPHWGTCRVKVSDEEVWERYFELKLWSEKRFPDMRIYLGRELSYRHGLEDEIQQKRTLAMAGSRHVLLEFMPDDGYSRIHQGLQAVLMAGFQPILAHAERYGQLRQNIKYIEELVHLGIYIQINAGSVTGENGWQCRCFTKKLLKNRLVHFVASDGHHADRRKPLLQKAVRYIARRYGRDYAMELSVLNPGRMIEERIVHQRGEENAEY